MKNAFSIIILTLTLLSNTAFAQQSCQDLFAEKTLVTNAPAVEITRIQLSESSLIHEKMDKNNPLFKKALQLLIKMHANTTFLNISEKISFEKGELFLAHRIDDNISLELEYAGDKRGPSTVFRLISYKIIQKNLKSSHHEKNPVNEYGNELNQNLIEIKRNLKDSGESRSKTLDLEIPLVISTDLLQFMERWAEKINLVNRQDIRDLIEQEKMIQLVLKAQYLSAVDFSKNIIKKQSYKYVLIGLVIYASSYAMENFINDKIDQVVSELQNTIKMSSEDQKLYQNVFSSIDKNWKMTNSNIFVDMQKLTTVLSKKDKISSIDAFRTTLANMTTQEFSLEGSPEHFVLNQEMSLVTELQDEKMVDLDFDKVHNKFLVSVYPKTESLQLSILNINEKSNLNSIASLVIYRAKNPSLYDALIEKIRELNPPNQP